jgi:hypothetical protein
MAIRDFRLQISDFRGVADFRNARAEKGRSWRAHLAVIGDCRLQISERFADFRDARAAKGRGPGAHTWR